MQNTQLERGALTGKSRKEHLNSPTLMLMVAIAAVGAIVYGRFLFNPQNVGDWIPYTLVLLAETFILFQVLFSLWTILAGGYNARDFAYHQAQEKLLGGRIQDHDLFIKNAHVKKAGIKQPMTIRGRAVTIDIFIPTYGEAVKTVEATAIAAQNVIGKHRTYILDDASSPAMRRMAEKIGVEYIARKNGKHAKAGNINNALKKTRSQYFVIFDADFVAEPMFLYETMPFFTDKSVAFVQTPQYYRNLDNVISRGAGFMQSLFYRLIQPGKNRFNAVFCVGTNVVFRRSAVDAIGGIYQESKSEDIWTSLLLHEKGYRSVFIPDILAVGETPDTIKAYSKQQLRWASGGFEILLKHNLLFSNKLSIDQRLQYLSTTTYYLHGVALLLLMLLPPLQIIFGLNPVNLSVAFGAWLAYYVAFYGSQIALAFYTMQAFRFETILVAMATFPVYIKALFNTVRGVDIAWQSTGTYKRDNPFNYVIPQLLIFLFLAFTTGVGVWQLAYSHQFSLSLVWNTLNMMLLGGFLAIAVREYVDGKVQAYKWWSHNRRRKSLLRAAEA